MDFEQSPSAGKRRIIVQRELPQEINIRTSGRLSFRRCRRLWGWTSPLKGNLEINVKPDYFWLGSGIHFALEDFHGYNYYQTPAAAFMAYVIATKQAGIAPAGIEELITLGASMMVYYKEYWLDECGRDPLQTYHVDGIPQVEVRFKLRLPIKGPQGQDVNYQGTFDGICIDEHDRLWIKEYKTAKNFAVGHFETDTQISAYCWAAEAIYGREVAGVVYQQHKKAFPSYPKVLSNGKVSTSKTMRTTPQMYAKVLAETYGQIDYAPKECRQYLSEQIKARDNSDFEAGDAFVRRDFVYRNAHQIAAEGEKILMEVEDMIRDDIPLYPSPTRDCSWQCPLESACIAIDDGSDFEGLLLSMTHERTEESEEWRTLLPHEMPQVPVKSLDLLPMEEVPEEVSTAHQVDPEQTFLELLGLGL